MINRIGSYQSYYNYQSTINQVRLQQALSRNQKYQSTITPVDRVDPVQNKYRSTSLDFLQEYSGTMGEVMESANSLRINNSAGTMRTLTAVSSDTEVAEVSQNYTLRQEKELSLDVSQLASAQQNISDAVRGSAAASGDIALTIAGQTSQIDVNVSAVKDDGTAKNNREMLREAAAQINKSNAGVTASVKEKDGMAVLSLESKATGTNAAFEISGQLGAAEGVQRTEVEAANAQYSVTANGAKRDYTSQSNQVQLDGGRMQATLKNTGETLVSAQVDSNKVVSAVSDLLESYNDAVSFLDKNQDHGRGVSAQLSRFESSLAAGETLKRLGISTAKDGSLVLDKEKLVDSLKKEPALTKDLLSGQNGLAQKLYDRGVNAMNTNSASLISNDLSELDQMRVIDPYQSMNMYNRSGAYAMNNYMALGLMMNYLV